MKFLTAIFLFISILSINVKAMVPKEEFHIGTILKIIADHPVTSYIELTNGKLLWFPFVEKNEIDSPKKILINKLSQLKEGDKIIYSYEKRKSEITYLGLNPVFAYPEK